MAALGAQTIASSYEQLLHTDTDGGGNGNTLVTIKDGDNGTTFGIKLATNKVEIIPGSNDANAFEVSQADGTAVFTVNTSSPAFTLTGNATITTSDNTDTLTLTSTDADANSGSNLRLYRNSGSPAGNDLLGNIQWEGRNNNSQDVVYAEMRAQIETTTDGSEDANFKWSTMKAGTSRDRLSINANSTVFNDDSVDVDFRVESNGKTHMLFVDAGQDRVGINNNDPGATLDVDALLPSSADRTIARFSAVAGTRDIALGWDDGLSMMGLFTPTNHSMFFGTNGVNQKMVINSDGNVGINDSDPSEAKLSIVNATAGDIGLKVDHDVVDTKALYIEAANTTADVIEVGANSLTSGRAMLVYSSADRNAGIPLVRFYDDNGSNDGTTLEVRQDGPALGMKIDQNGDSSAILIESASTTANVLNLSSMATTTGTIITLNACDDLTSGKALYIDSNHDDNTGRYLVWIQNNHVNAAETRCFYTQQDANAINSEIRSANGSFTDTTLYIPVERSGTDAFNFIRTFTTGDSDTQHALRGNGELDADGAYSSGGADYAEYFESKDGKAITVGITVKLDGDKVVACEDGDTPIGVVRPSSNSVVIGNSAPFKWASKYLKDDYGAYIKEEYTLTEWIEYTDEIRTEAKNGKDVVYEHNDFCYHTDRVPSDVTVPSDAVITSEDANGNKLMRNKLNPDYDESKSYKPRKERDEWCLIGLLGQIPITKGQPMASNWIKMKDVSDTVELWMVK